MSWQDDLPPIPTERLREAARTAGAARLRRRRLAVGAATGLAMVLIIAVAVPLIGDDGSRPTSVAVGRGDDPATTSTAVTTTTSTSTTIAVAAGGCAATGRRGRILFVRRAAGPPWHIYSVEPDGSCLTQLTHDDGNPAVLNWGASWSPSGDRIAFTRMDVGLIVMAADGSSQRLLSPQRGTQGSGSWSAWSPDGTRIALAGRSGGIWLVDSASGKTTNLVTEESSSPSWSPDGSRIVFCAYGAGGPENFRVVTVRPDGTGRTDLGTGCSPSWGPDGRIAFSPTGAGIALMNADGSNVRRLIEDESVGVPVWSPDGSQLVFSRGGGGILVINADGSGMRTVVEHDGDSGATW